MRNVGKLTGDQLKQVEQIITQTTAAMARRKDELIASVAADRQSVASNKEKVVALQQEISTLTSADNAQDRLTAEQQEYLNLIKQLSSAITQLRSQQVNTNEEIERTNSVQNDATIATQNNTKATQQNTSTLGKAVKQVFTYGSALQILRRAYTTIISTISDMDKALTGMAVVTTMSREEA